MSNLSKTIRKSLKPACLTATLATCWQAGQVAKADIIWPPTGSPITIQFQGTVSPSTESLSHMFLIYSTGTSSSMLYPLNILSLGNFAAGQNTSFSIAGDGYCDGSIWWYTAALYGDTSSGQYTEGVNGVTLCLWDSAGDPWDLRVPIPEATAFSYLLNDTPENLPAWQSWDQRWLISGFGSSDTWPLLNFSNASPNGELQMNIEFVPEPTDILWLATGAMILAALRRRSGPSHQE